MTGGCPLDAQPAGRPGRPTTTIAVVEGLEAQEPENAVAAAAGAARVKAFAAQPEDRQVRARAAQTTNTVVIVGDSFSSGEGIGRIKVGNTVYDYYGGRNGDCHRHLYAWGGRAAFAAGIPYGG